MTDRIVCKTHVLYQHLYMYVASGLPIETFIGELISCTLFSIPAQFFMPSNHGTTSTPVWRPNDSASTLYGICLSLLLFICMLLFITLHFYLSPWTHIYLELLIKTSHSFFTGQCGFLLFNVIRNYPCPSLTSWSCYL